MAKPCENTAKRQPSENSIRVNDILLEDLLADKSLFVEKITRMLDYGSIAVNTWKQLACILDIPISVRNTFACDTEYSPTEDLFEHLLTLYPDLTFRTLKNMLRRVGRNDLVLQLKNHKDDWRVSDHVDVVGTLKPMLDISNRFLNWRVLACKWNIPRKTFEKFGKPKIGPAEHLFTYVKSSSEFESLTVEELKMHLKKMDRCDSLSTLSSISNDALVSDMMDFQSPTISEFIDQMNKDGSCIKNWKNLAYYLGIKHDVYSNFGTAKVKEPSKRLFQWIAANRPNFTVKTLIQGLRDIGRNDIVGELTVYLSDKSAVVG